MTRNEPELPEAHEPSYYEIALTNRQVVGAFVVLLVCLLASFLGGLWVGRESAAREAEAALRNAPPPAQVADNGEKTDKLDFFSVPQGSTQIEPQEGKAPAKGNTLRDQLDRNDQTLGTPPVTATGDTDEAVSVEDETPAPEPAPPAPAPRAGGKPVPEKPPAADAKTDRKKPQDSQKPGKGDRTERAEKGDPEPPKGSFVVQVFSTSEKDQALKVRSRLIGGGEKAYLSPVKAANGTMYRVRIGPFTSRDAAQKIADKVRKGYKLDTWVTQ